MPRLLERPETAPTVLANSQQRTRLNVGSMHAGYKVRFTGTLTNAVAVATILEDSPLGFLRSVDFVLGGSFPLRVHDARFVNFWNRYSRRTANRITPPLAAIGASNFSAEFIVDLQDLSLRGGLARGFLLDSRKFSNMELAFTYGVDADVATPGGGGTAVLSALAVNVVGMQVPDLRGELSRQSVTFTQQAIAATGILDLPLFNGQGVQYRAFALHFTSGNADPLRATSDDTICADVTLMENGSPNTRYFDAVPYEAIRAENKRTRGIETLQAGWCVLDFAPNEDLEDVVVSQSNALSMRLNIAAAPANSFVRVYPIVLLRRLR